MLRCPGAAIAVNGPEGAKVAHPHMCNGCARRVALFSEFDISPGCAPVDGGYACANFVGSGEELRTIDGTLPLVQLGQGR